MSYISADETAAERDDRRNKLQDEALRVFGIKLSQRIDKLSPTDREDIVEQAVAYAAHLLKEKVKLSKTKKKFKFTGYYQNGLNKIYGMQAEDVDNGFTPKVIYRVMGHNHRVVTLYLDFEQRKEKFISEAKILGFKVYREKGRGFIIRIPKARKQWNKKKKSNALKTSII